MMWNRVFIFAVVLLLATLILVYYTTEASNLDAKPKHGVKHLRPHPSPAAPPGENETFPLAGHAGEAATAATIAALRNPAFIVQPPAGTETALPFSTTTTNDSAAAISIANRLAREASNAGAVTDPAKCSPPLGHINPEKEARFTVVNPCVTVSGTVTWTHYFNDDGDANFNVALDAQYKNMLSPGSYSNVFASKYPGGPAMHMEVICQSIVTSRSSLNTGACDGYTGPIYGLKNLPKIGQHVQVTGRYLTEMPEMPGGITELHPVYGMMKSAPPGKLTVVGGG